MLLATPAMSSANANGIWCATFATAGLALQAFVGTNLQSPGVYRIVLRRWHSVLFWVVAIFSVVHVALNGTL